MNTSVTRVVITGSECTGKTTMAARLAAHFGVQHVPEFVRRYAEQKGAPVEAIDHWPIAHGQVAEQDAALARALAATQRLLVLDTDLLSHVTYCHHYTGGCDAGIEQMARARLADHYLLLDIDVPWVPDGIRDRGDRRDEVHALFVDTLERFGAPYTLVRGSWDERLSAALRSVNAVLGRSS